MSGSVCSFPSKVGWGSGVEIGEGGEHLVSARHPDGPPAYDATTVEQQRRRCAGDAEGAHKVEMRLGVDLDMTYARHLARDIVEQVPGRHARPAERAGELHQRRALAELASLQLFSSQPRCVLFGHPQPAEAPRTHQTKARGSEQHSRDNDETDHTPS